MKTSVSLEYFINFLSFKGVKFFFRSDSVIVLAFSIYNSNSVG